MMAEHSHPNDELIVAYLDGELDETGRSDFAARLASEPDLRERLAILESGGADIPAAMETLKAQAPKARLDDILARAIAEHDESGGDVVPLRRMWPQAPLTTRQMVAAAVALFLLGGIANEFIRGREAPRPPAPVAEVASVEDWRQAVAEYWSLTTPDTLAIAPTPDRAAAELSLASQKLGVDLAGVPDSFPGLSFRGAQLFDFRGKALVQMAFLDPEHGPIAYCVIENPARAEIPPTTETLDGFTIVHWASGGQSRLLIGRAPAERLQALAGKVSS
jgi:anti-sigma factor RsiW